MKKYPNQHIFLDNLNNKYFITVTNIRKSVFKKKKNIFISIMIYNFFCFFNHSNDYLMFGLTE